MADTHTVETTTGRVQGGRGKGAIAFRGVPYAADPAGPLRFAPPSPHPGWTGVRSALEPGPGVPQAPSRLASIMGTPQGRFAEQGCLALNVWTPDTTGRAPVLLWLHGGAGVTGASGWSWYDGGRLAAEQGIVVVTPNYRLGPLGYLYLAEVADDLGAGNFGWLDQVAALEWVVANIEAFGGDPRSITVGGHSAGAPAAALLAVAPRTRRHVRRIFLQSGALDMPAQPIDQAAEVAADYLAILGIGKHDIARLRELDAGELVAASGRLTASRARLGNVAMPIGLVAGETLPAGDPVTELTGGTCPELDIMLGTTANEMAAFFHRDPRAVTADKAQILAALSPLLGDATEELYAGYAQESPAATPGRLLSDLLADRLLRMPALRLAERRARDGHAAHLYQFDWSASDFGACHCIDLPFAFGNLHSWPDAAMLGTADRASLDHIARPLTSAIGAFVRTGRPQNPALPNWPAYEPADRATMRFDNFSEVVADLAAPQRRLHQKLRPDQN
ncbi:MAG TPA: carboxylesterase family protein [Pseudonocardiaceae bacterium]|nr:carboxylesterase family protein [Pseudonocardiaceae bacterium]